MSTTTEDLKMAFAGESQANRKYLAFARKADKEQLPGIARLFRAAAEAETIHALGHLQNMNGVGTTMQNLEAAVAGENYEYIEMYPPMVEQAEKENHKAKTLLRYALQVERVHAGLFAKALAALGGGADLDTAQIFLCPACGDIEIGQPPERCPICNAVGSKFERIA
jgi:rubrerythrin